MKNQKRILSIAVIFMISLMGAVYASYSVLTVKINATAHASASIFDVGFANVEPVIYTQTNEEVDFKVYTPEEGAKEITLSVSGLKQPGDKVDVLYTIINNGDIDASDITVRSGPAIGADEDWSTDFHSPGSTWISEDGVFKFGAYQANGGLYDDEQYWDGEVDGSYPLETGKKGLIMVRVELLKRVEQDTDCSCTMKLIAMPDGADVGIVE